MSKDSKNFFRPKNDDRPILDIIFGLAAGQTMFVAHEIGLFEILQDKSLTLNEIADSLSIELRPAKALVYLCTSVKLLLKSDDKYKLSTIAEEYLLKRSPTYYGGLLDFSIANSKMFTFESLKQALFSNKSQVYSGKDVFETNEHDLELAKSFTRMMHSKSTAASTYWPEKIDLSNYKTMLDVAGGSGAHAIGACSMYPELKSIIFERPLVCEVAREFIEKSKMTQKISTHEGDMWNDSFPEADIHFYSDIFHDWTPENCKILANKSYRYLKPGGRIVIHEMLFDDQKTGPSSVASYNVNMLLVTQGQQFSGEELLNLLDNVGFKENEVIRTGFGDWSLVTGLK